MPMREGIYGLLAEFDTPGDLIRAAKQARLDGWRRLDCYTPYPVEEAAEAIGVTFLMHGGPATIYGARAYDAFCEFADAQADQ